MEECPWGRTSFGCSWAQQPSGVVPGTGKKLLLSDWGVTVAKLVHRVETERRKKWAPKRMR